MKSQETTTPIVEDPSVSELTPEDDSFGEAVNTAMAAAEATQTAQTADEWGEVAELWGKAIELMKAVSEESENYQTAQQKVSEYQPNLEYAQQNISAEPTQGEAEKFYQAAMNAYLEQDVSTALANFDRAIEIDPSYAMAYYNRGVVRINLGQKDAAIQDLEKAAELFAALNDEGGIYHVNDRLQQLQAQ